MSGDLGNSEKYFQWLEWIDTGWGREVCSGENWKKCHTYIIGVDHDLGLFVGKVETKT